MNLSSEKLLNAVIFEGQDQLESLVYSKAEATDRLRYDSA